MNPSIYNISLDIRFTTSSVVVWMKRGDTNRKIFVTLTDNGEQYHITEGCRAVFTAVKPDGTILFNDCIIVENTILYEVTPQTTSVAGSLPCEIKLYGADGKLITSPAFLIMMDDTVYQEGEVESSNEFSTLTNLVSEVNAKMLNGDFNGNDGEDGKDGTSVTHEWTGTTLNITSASGTSSVDLKGEQGIQGEPGETPVKGVDYYTDEDVNEIVDLVMAALPNAKGVSF